MKPNKLEIINRKSGLYDVLATEDGLMAEGVCREEALGCIASWIYSAYDVPQFMENELERAKRSRFNGFVLTEREKAALIANGEPLEEPGRRAENDPE